MKLMNTNKFMNMNHMPMNDYELELYEPNFSERQRLFMNVAYTAVFYPEDLNFLQNTLFLSKMIELKMPVFA